MNFSWLEDFLALAASGNFSRAAQERHMTQPAFSRRVRALEEWVGTELFDRSSQPATLTPAGEWFRTSAHDLLARVARVPGEARAVAEAHSTTLRFAATHALSFTFMPGWLRALEQRTRVGPVRLVSDVLQRCEAMLLHGQVQFVLCHAHPKVPGELQAQDYPSVCVAAMSWCRCRHRTLAAAPATRWREPALRPRCRSWTTAPNPAWDESCTSCGVRHGTALRHRTCSPRTWLRCCAPWRWTGAASPGCRER